MATGNYGTIRPADPTVDDVEILYCYSPDREDLGSLKLLSLNPAEVLVPAMDPNVGTEVLGGLYTLQLPTQKFGSKGFYNIIIRPKQIRTQINNCGVLTDLPDIKGLVFNIATISADDKNRFENGNLVGYRVEYLDLLDPTIKLPNFYTIITSNNRALPITPASGGANTNDTWSLNDNSQTTFCTVTPASAPSVNPNAFPDIGQPQQNVIITNTFFDPIMLEIEMVEYDHETLAYALYSNQSKSLDDGIYTIYNFDNEIYKQYNLYEVKNQFTGKPLFEIREQKSIIDTTKGFDNVTDITVS